MSENRLILILVLLLCSTALSKKSGDLQIKIQENRGTINASISLSNYSFEHLTEEFSKITFDGAVHINEEGKPELPYKQFNFQLESNTNVSVEVISSTYKDVHMDKVLSPARRQIFRSEDPASVPYYPGKTYAEDAFYPKQITNLLEPYLIRSARGVSLQVFPIQYNPLTNIIRIYTKIELKLIQTSSPTAKNCSPSPTSVPPSFEDLYKDLFVNYKGRRNTLAQKGDMLVIHTPRDKESIQAYVDHKKRYDLFVKDVTTQEVPKGTNVKEIIKEAYKTNPNLLYVQLVGDWDDIKSDLGGGEEAPMDPMLGCVSGSDNFADLIIGRFSCRDVETLMPQIEKAIAYESNGIQPWMMRAMGIGSEYGGNGIGDDNESDFDHMQVIKEHKLLPNGYTEVHECYKEVQASTVFDNITDGVGLINYAGHGSKNAWQTSGFSNSDIRDLENSATPVIIAAACENGTFHKDEICFAEQWLQQKNGGAVAALMATISQNWEPPMRGQDYMNDLITGGYDYKNNPGEGTSTTEGRQTFGSVAFNGMILMYAEQSSMYDLQVIQTWTLFGDCALDLRPSMEISIIMTDSSVTGASELIFAPNPVPAEATEVTFVTPSELRGEWTVFIYDVMGNLLDEATFNGAGGKRYSWDLRNKAGMLVGSGEYLALIRYTDNKGVLKEYERVIGIQK